MVGPVFRQMIVVVSSQLAAISVGGAVTYPTLLMETFRTGGNGTDIQLNLDTKSWIGSIYGLAGIPAILMPILTQKIGRKLGYIITCFFLIVGWILAFKATTITELLVSECFHGLSTNSLLPVTFLGLTEMLPPKYRGPSIQTFGIAQGIGMASCGILGRYLPYHIIAMIMLVPIVIATAIAIMWPESPSWFAYKGRFNKCEQAFVKLRGTDEMSKKELLELITAQRYSVTSEQRKTISLRNFWKRISSRDFYMPSFDTFVLFLAMYWSGCDVIYIYFIEIVAETTNFEDAAFYVGIAMYIIVLSGLIITNILLRKFQNKTVVIFSACCVIVCLFVSSLISGLQTLGLMAKGSSLLMYCLIGYMASASLGLNGVVFLISSELMPVKHRSLGGALYIIVNCALYASSQKLSPYITLRVGLWFTFLIFACNGSVCLWYIWKRVPETSGRSLQEIEDFYTLGSFKQRRVEIDSCDQMVVPSIK